MTQHERYLGDDRVVREYEVDTLGAPFKVILKNCVTLSVDRASGKEKVTIPDVTGLINSVVRARVTHPRKLNGQEIRFVRNALGVKASLLADFLEMSPSHLSRCEAGKKVMSTLSERFFRLFAFLGTYFKEPEELFVQVRGRPAIEQTTKKPNEMAKEFVEQFLSMKIQSVYDATEELEFEFFREPAEDSDEEFPQSVHEDQWKPERREAIAAYG